MNFRSLGSSCRFTGQLLRLAVALAACCYSTVAVLAQQKPKRNSEVIITLEACAPDVTYQPNFPTNYNGTLTLGVWETNSGFSVGGNTWNGNPGGGITHTGAQHIKVLPNREYSVTLTRLSQPMAWGDLKLSAPPGYAVFIRGVPCESYHIVPSEWVNGILTFNVREIGDGGRLPAGMALPPDVGDFVWTMSTGTYLNGQSLSPVQMRGPSLSAAMLSPKALNFINPYSSEVAVTSHSDGGLLELETFQAIYYFKRGSPSGGYTIEVYSPYATRTGSGDGPYTYSELPFREFRISNPDGATWNNKLKIEKVERDGGTSTSETWTVEQNGSNWTVVETSSLRTITRASTTNSGIRTEVVTVADNNATVATKLSRKYQTFGWGQEELIEETLNPSPTEGIALTTKYYYHESYGTGGYARLKAVEAPDGSWVRYDYDDSAAGLGNLKAIYKPWRGAPASYSAATDSNSSTTAFSYASGKTSYVDVPSGSVSKIAGNQSGQVDVITNYPATAAANGQPLREDKVKIYSAAGSGNALTTVTQVYDPTSASAAFRGRKYSEVFPDRTQISHLYFQAYFQNIGDNNMTRLFTAASNNNTWGEYRFHGFSEQVSGSVLINGAFGGYIAPLYMVPNHSTVDLVVYNDKGRPQYKVNYVFTGFTGGPEDYQFLSLTEILDDGGIAAVQQSFTGYREQRVFNGELLTAAIANDGSMVEFTRDALGRDYLSKKTGMAASGDFAAQGAIYTHKTFDASNRVLTEKISSSAISTDAGIETSNTYYLNGLPKSKTDSSGLASTIVYSNGGRTTTVTSPLGTNTADSHQLGSYVYGSTVIPQFSRVVANSDGTITSESYVLTAADKAAVDGAFAKPTLAEIDSELSLKLALVKRWSKVTTDWLGRTIREERPTPQGTTPTSITKQYFFNGFGQLTKTTETNLASTLVAYNALKEPYRTGLDISTTSSDNTPNDQLDLNSKDRITETESVFEKIGSIWWSKVTTKVYNNDATGDATTVSVVRTRINGYSDHGRFAANYIQSEVQATDIFGNATTKTVSVQRGSTYTGNDIRLVTETVDPSDSTTNEVSVIRNGLLQSRQSKEGLVYKTYYDALGRPTKTTDPRTDTSSTTPRIGYFDGTATVGNRHKVAWREDTAGNRTTYTYSSNTGLLFSETNALTKAVYHAYNARGQEKRTWGAATQPVEYGFNDYGERTTMRTWREAPSNVNFSGTTWGEADYPSTTGDVTTWSFDAATGVLLSKTVPAAEPGSSDSVRNAPQVVSYTYNARGQLKTRDWARAYGAGKLTTTYSYFGEGTNEPKTGELRFVDYEDNTPDVTYTYNRQSLPKTIVDATGTRSFEYCDCGKPLYEHFDSNYFGGRKLTYKIDDLTSGARGRTYGYTIAIGTATPEQDISYGFDASGRFNKLTNNSSGIVFDYTYAANSNLLSSIANTTHGWTQTRTYEASRDVLDVIETKVGATTKAKFDYIVDTLGRRSDVTKTGEMFGRYGATGVDTHWDYNDRNEVTDEIMKEGGTQNALKGRTLGFVFDFMGNRKTATVDNRTLTYASNPLNQYDSVAGRNFSDVTGFAPAAATVTVNGTTVPAANRKGDYFAASVTPATQPAWQDATIVAGSESTTRKIFLPAATEPMKYDADGNLTSDGRWNYVYDAENRLVSAETKIDLLATPPTLAKPMPIAESKRLEFSYDYMGRRVEKRVLSSFNGATYGNEVRTRFLYDSWNLAAEYTTTVGTSTTLTLAKVYTWGLDWSGTRQGAGGVGGLQFVTDHQVGAAYFPVYDGNGNVMGLVNTTGAFSAIYEYDAFGQTLRADGVAASVNPFRYSTKFTDSETGLIYYGHRYYYPLLGRFICRDPKEEDGGRNLYAFLHNNAVNHADLLGWDTASDPFHEFNVFLGELLTPTVQLDPFVVSADREDFQDYEDYDDGRFENDDNDERGEGDPEPPIPPTPADKWKLYSNCLDNATSTYNYIVEQTIKNYRHINEGRTAYNDAINEIRTNDIQQTVFVGVAVTGVSLVAGPALGAWYVASLGGEAFLGTGYTYAAKVGAGVGLGYATQGTLNAYQNDWGSWQRDGVVGAYTAGYDELLFTGSAGRFAPTATLTSAILTGIDAHEKSIAGEHESGQSADRFNMSMNDAKDKYDKLVKQCEELLK